MGSSKCFQVPVPVVWKSLIEGPISGGGAAPARSSADPDLAVSVKKRI